jgi:hypothetical protein
VRGFTTGDKACLLTEKADVGSTSILPDADLGMHTRITKPAASTRSGCNPSDILTT